MTVYLMLRSIVTVILLLSSVILHRLQCQVHNHALSPVILAIVKRTMVKSIVCQPHMNYNGTGSECNRGNPY